ncbi:unnamed protein product [Aphanomyces euteiches]|uniref:Uncharacterized protein n=1 Tax=Aphanomyces euteiches TaxID=100861 RepID=A0A6G0WIF3_9STRA|nr:hypothetical protein Ae201684_014859 [Aphanomyces euteiches]KAH9072635.1 hypothetical protein Ae201684P_015710 [Aphanomyces euteiches]
MGSILFMRSSALTVLLSFISLVLSMFSLAYPAWFQQEYKPVNGSSVYQSFGLFAFYSTNQLTNPFYASQTTFVYSDFCSGKVSAPNWMLGFGTAFNEVLCGSYVSTMQGVMIAAVVFAGISLLAAIAACYFPAAGYAERTVSGATFLASLCLLAVLITWSVYFQQKLLDLTVVQTEYSQCKSFTDTGASWSCWFYGYNFWVAIAAVFGLLLTTYASAAGRAAKIQHFRKEYEHNLVIAIQASAMTAPAGGSREQPLLTPAGPTLSEREMALALQQSREEHELNLAIQQSLMEQQQQNQYMPPPQYGRR